ncbi:hypothetical protein ACFFWC_25265 [Plantactinospora siamensis]|uniref:Uncharacterized protein n=1 Tax=Plantactinospora siamensis TaxID=555372 RepID=A0ABV6NY26_9ACTN
MRRTAVPGTVTNPAEGTLPRRRTAWERATSLVGHRWPTWLALALAAVTVPDVGDGSELALVLVLAACAYLFMAVTDRVRCTWPVLVGFVVTVVVLKLLDIDPRPVFVVVTAALAVVGLIGGQLRGAGLRRLQAPAALGFVALGLISAPTHSSIGPYLLAAGLLGHAAWDAVHWRANRIVTRSFSEWCGVLDLTLGLGILVLATMS